MPGHLLELIPLRTMSTRIYVAPLAHVTTAAGRRGETHTSVILLHAEEKGFTIRFRYSGARNKRDIFDARFESDIWKSILLARPSDLILIDANTIFQK